MAAFEQARQAIIDAHTVEPTGIAIKLAVLSESACSEEVTSIARDLAAAGMVTPRLAV